MFDIGFWEILLIAVVALLVVGPNEFPSMVRNAGRAIGKVRGFLSSVKADIEHEVDKADEIKKLMEQEANIAMIHERLDISDGALPRQPNATEASKIDKADESKPREPGPNNTPPGETESNPESAQPLGDRRPD